MNVAFQAILAVGLLVMGLAQVSSALELRRLRSHLMKKPTSDQDWPLHASSHVHADFRPGGLVGSPAGFAIYVYRGGRWQIESDLSAPGFEPSAPTLAGSYEGQVLKKESCPAADR